MVDWRKQLWPIGHHVVARLVPYVLGALLGLLGDAALLDAQLVETLQDVISG